MGGAKYVHGVEICSEECCPGYEEVIDNPPLLSPGKALSKAWEDEELAHSPIRMRRQSVMSHFPHDSSGLLQEDQAHARIPGAWNGGQGIRQEPAPVVQVMAQIYTCHLPSLWAGDQN